MRGGRAVRAKKQAARRGRQGFTLVEVIVVLVILAVLAALLIPSMVKWIDKSHEKICQVNRSDIARFYQAALPLEPELQRDSQNGQADKVLPFLRETGYVEEGMKCPDGGTYLSLYDNVNGGVIFVCSKHLGDVSEAVKNQVNTGTVYEYGSSALKNYIDIMGDDTLSKDEKQKRLKELGIESIFANKDPSLINNESFRKAVYKKNGGWGELKVDGQTFYVQPYYNTVKQDKTENSLVIFANTNPNNSGNWTANYIYNRDDGSWYQCATGSKSINGKSWSDIKYDLENEKTYNGSPQWVKVDKIFGLPDGTEGA